MPVKTGLRLVKYSCRPHVPVLKVLQTPGLRTQTPGLDETSPKDLDSISNVDEANDTQSVDDSAAGGEWKLRGWGASV